MLRILRSKVILVCRMQVVVVGSEDASGRLAGGVFGMLQRIVTMLDDVMDVAACAGGVVDAC